MRNVLITGGSRGLGLGIADALARAGFRVIAVARREGEQLATLRERLRDAPSTTGALHFHACDLADIDGLAGMVKALHREFGAFHGLVNNAGLGTAGVLANMPEHAIEQLVRLNVLSPLTVTKHVVRSMMAAPGAEPGRATSGGRIVNISSVVSMTGYNGLSVYSATKAALIGFTRSLARELGPLGITVNAVAPGFVDTEMTHELTPAQRERIARRSALQRLPEVADIADAVEYLFSDRARNVTGTVMTVDAGNTA